jgi:L-ascorbate metabolism protein UlaG (beta-lactamase superfamily)
MKITMLGHATLLIEIDGKTILTDPWLTDPLYFGQLRHNGNFEPIDKLPHIDLLLVSHGHDDHFDPATLSKISKTVPIVICNAYQKKARKAGFQEIYSMREGKTCSLDSLRIKALPGKHIGGISTFLIKGKKESIFFGGDSEASEELENALSEENPDVCLMPISGGGIGLIKFHMNSKEAACLVRSSKAKFAIPIHYHFKVGLPFCTQFLIKNNSLDAFQAEMAAICPETKVVSLDYNESFFSK